MKMKSSDARKNYRSKCPCALQGPNKNFIIRSIIRLQRLYFFLKKGNILFIHVWPGQLLQ